MAISTSVEVVDRVSGALNRITASLYSTTAAFGSVDRASEIAFNASGVQAMAQEVYAYEQRVQQLEADLVDANNRLEQMENNTQRAVQSANMLENAFGAVKGIITTIGVQKIFETSDGLVQTTSRLGMMNDGLQSTQELVNMVYASAQDARGSFSGMADVIARFGNNAGDAFDSTAEIVDFANLVQKQMTIAGASTAESSNAMLQLSQALGSGTLRGDELNSIFEQAPNLIQNIADYLDVPIGQIREMASEGQLSADIVKAAVFAASDEINEKFDDMPMTWAQIWQSMQNTALMKFQPVLQRLNDIAKSDGFQGFANSATTAMAMVANATITIFDAVGAVGTFIADNWSIIGPIVYGVVAALAAYALYLGIVNGIELISNGIKIASCIASYAHAAATGTEASATAAATAAQYGFNTALLACPVTWIVLAIIALIAVLVIVANKIAETGDVAGGAFGVICGWVNVGIQWFKNFGLTIANIALGIWNALGACAENIGIAFSNAISGVKSWFYGLLSTALSVIESICAALNKLPFVDFDYSSITSAANEYASKSAAEAENKQEYASLGDAFSQGMSTYETWGDGWVSDAFDAGSAWGAGVADKVSSGIEGLTASLDTSAIDSAYTGTGAGSVADSLSNIAGDTSAISDSVDITDENLKYLRDIAERDVINRFTTAEIKVDMQNTNTINSNMDIDGIVDQLTTGVADAMAQAAEGVH